MSGSTPSDANDEISPALVQVRNTVAAELDAQLALRGEAILLADVCEVAYAVAVRLRRAFRIECRSSWQGELQDDDSLGLDGAAFYGSVMLNENDQRSSDRYPIFDHKWPYLSMTDGPFGSADA